jgi:hypothetical protein
MLDDLKGNIKINSKIFKGTQIYNKRNLKLVEENALRWNEFHELLYIKIAYIVIVYLAYLWVIGIISNI